jgi:protein-glucosylgalactosylhydroxylysine glucosidase
MALLFRLPGIEPDAGDPATWPRRPVVLPSGWRSLEVQRLWLLGRPMRLEARHRARHAKLTPHEPLNS